MDPRSHRHTGARKIMKTNFTGDCAGRDPHSTRALVNQHNNLISKWIKTRPNDMQTFCMIYCWKGIEVFNLLQFTKRGFDVCRKRYGQKSDERSNIDNNKMSKNHGIRPCDQRPYQEKNRTFSNNHSSC